MTRDTILDMGQGRRHRQEWNAFKKVRDFFENDITKTLLWFSQPNPNFGNISPLDMIRRGRSHKVIQFIENAIDENKK